MTTVRHYMPSNATEGEAFTEHFCMRCLNGAWDRDPDGPDDPCPITLDTTRGVPREEWVLDHEHYPTCTSFQPMPDNGEGILADPRQLTMKVTP